MKQSDSVLIEGLKTDAVIGIYDWEQEIRQPLIIDIEMQWDNRKPASTGAIENALDYEAISKSTIKWIQERPWGLIEEVAEHLATQIHERFSITALTLKVSKPGAVKEATNVAVKINRQW